ncbi:MAG: VOC family protein [Acidobacteriota bacterium]
MPTINPILSFDGNTEEAFNFYKSVFGGEFQSIMRWKESPGGDKRPANEGEKIMHVSLPVGGNVLMGGDALESMGQRLTAGNNFHIAIAPEIKNEADRIFSALAEGGKIEMPLQDSFWGAYFGMLEDKFGIHWMMNYEYPK